MTRVLHILESVSTAYGGPAEAARRLGSRWLEQGHRYDILTLDPPEEQHIRDFGGKVIALGPPRDDRLRNRYRYSPEMVPWLREHASSYDAVIVSGLWRYMARGGRRALSGGQVPYFVFTHGMLDPWFRKTYPLKHLVKQVSWWLAEGPLLAEASVVMFTCEEEKRLAEGAFWPYKANGVSVGYGTADVSGDPAAQIAAFRAVMPQLGDRPYLLFLSRIHRKKGCDLLVDAFAASAAAQPDLQLVIAGPDDTGLVSGLKAQAERLGVADRVHFPGMVKGDVKYGALRGAAAFVLTSHQENFGIAVAEAMACGTPVLISDKVNIWREIAHDGAGLVEADTRDGSRRLLERFAAMSPAERKIMGEKARKSFLARFHVDDAADRIMQLMEAHVRSRE